jgi:5-methylcytosine-specific restriction endonuclease McrA
MFGWLLNRRPDDYGAPRSGQWPRVRREHLSRQPECQACGRTKEMEVHHIRPFHDNPALELDPQNLITLCADPCHIVHGHLMSWLRSNKSVVEDCAAYRKKLAEASRPSE